MPRGFLKNANSSRADVGKKASRGGGSRSKAKAKAHPTILYTERASRSSRQRQLLSLAEEGIGDYESDYDYDSDEEDFFVEFENDLTDAVDGLPDEISDHSFVAVSEINSIGKTASSEYTFCDDVESTAFSIIEGSSIGAMSKSSDSDQSYVAIDACGSVSQVSTETPRKGPVLKCNGRDKEEGADRRFCSICLEEKPLIHLMKKCRCHPSSCKDCLRAMYIVHSLDDPHCAYPLRCFWPDCDTALRDVQVKKVARDHRDIEKYYQFEAQKKNERLGERRRLNDLGDQARCLPLAKRREIKARRLALGARAGQLQTVQTCPSCQHPNSIRPYYKTDAKTTLTCCVKCFNPFRVEKLPRKEAMAVLAALGDEVASCPWCGAFFVKDGGCDHMTCLCGKEFSFSTSFRLPLRIGSERMG